MGSLSSPSVSRCGGSSSSATSSRSRPSSELLAVLAGLGLFALDPAGEWILWAIGFVGAAAGLAAVALKARRFGLFALGALGVYAGISRLAFELIGDAGFGCFWFAGSSLGMIALLWIVQRRFRVEVT